MTDEKEQNQNTDNQDNNNQDNNSSNNNNKQCCVFGLDFGTRTSVLASFPPSSNLPRLVLNNLSNLETPSLVSFRGKQRVVGEEAESRVVSDCESTISQLKRIIGKKHNQIAPELLFNLPFTINNTDPLTISVNYGEEGEKHDFTTEQMMAILLLKLSSFVKKAYPSDSYSFVIAVPSKFTSSEQQAIMDAATIAGLHVISLTSDNHAAGTLYGYHQYLMKQRQLEKGKNNEKEEKEKPQEMEIEKPNRVLVVDMGHAYLSVSLFAYIENQIQVLSSASEEIGSGHFDDNLANHFIQILQEKFKGCEIGKRSRCKIWAAARKAKEVLSTIPSTPFDVDLSQMSIPNFTYIVTRTILEQTSTHLLQKIKQTIEKVLSDSGQSILDIDSVEIIGGGTRMPLVQDVINNIFANPTKKFELRRTLDSASCVAEGAALLAGIWTGTVETTLSVSNISKWIPTSAGLSESLLSESIKLEKTMQENEEKLAATASKKNQLEEYIFNTTDSIHQPSFSSFLTTNKEQLISKFQQAKEWLYGEGEEASYDVYEAKITELTESLKTLTPSFYEELQRIEEQKRKAVEAAAEERRKKQSEPTTGSRDKDERPLTKQEKFEAAKKRKNQGNICFKDGEYEAACNRYVQGIGLAEEIYNTCSDDMKKELDSIKLGCYLNIAACCLKLNLHLDRVIINCDKALEIDKKNVKALFRKGQALMGMKDWEAARAPLVQALEIEPNNAEVSRLLQTLKKTHEQHIANQKKLYSKMFS